MKLQAALKKLSKVGAKNVDVIDNKVLADYKGERFKFFFQKDSSGVAQITSVHTHSIRCINNGDVTDSMTDYFPGMWHNNLTAAIRFTDSYTARFGN